MNIQGPVQRAVKSFPVVDYKSFLWETTVKPGLHLVVRWTTLKYMVTNVLVIITTYKENELTYLLNCRSKIKQNVLFQRFKQKMTEAALLKGNSTLKQSGLMIMQHLQHEHEHSRPGSAL